MRKFALHLTDACELFDGSKYKSSGTTITEFARITGGGNENVLHTPALARAAAMVERNVVNATGGIDHPIIAVGDKYGANNPRTEAMRVFDILNGDAPYPSTPMPPFCTA